MAAVSVSVEGCKFGQLKLNGFNFAVVHRIVSVEGCKFVQLKPIKSSRQSKTPTVSVEGCKFVQLKRISCHLLSIRYRRFS